MKKNENIRFSIIIPNYNKGIYIKECLDSIVKQTFSNYEIIFVDDGSSDNSLDVIKNYEVRLFKTDRRQAGGARNLGVKNARGEYIVFLDSDDYLASNDVLEKVDKMLFDEDLIFLNYTMIQDGVITERKDVSGDLLKRLEKSKFLGAPTKVFKRTLIENMSFPECQKYEDIVYTLEAMCKTKKYKILDEPFFVYRRVVDSNSTSNLTIESMSFVMSELFKIYKLCVKYPKYKDNLLVRLKDDKIDKRVRIINYMLENNLEEMEVEHFYNIFYNDDSI